MKAGEEIKAGGIFRKKLRHLAKRMKKGRGDEPSQNGLLDWSECANLPTKVPGVSLGVVLEWNPWTFERFFCISRFLKLFGGGSCA